MVKYTFASEAKAGITGGNCRRYLEKRCSRYTAGGWLCSSQVMQLAVLLLLVVLLISVWVCARVCVWVRALVTLIKVQMYVKFCVHCLALAVD